jgi:tetratricopeptide (TPR) repeat protein
MTSPSPNADRSRARVAAARRPSPERPSDLATASGDPLRGAGDNSRRSVALRDGLAAVALAIVTFTVFIPALRCGFINFDDPNYVLQNEPVSSGITLDGVRWAFTTFTQANWHPLTWLSLQLDASIWGAKPFGFHLTNVVLHAANAALLFLALWALTGSFRRAAVVALLFAVHPLRVESVAWVAERKDVLATFFGLAALRAYAGYVRSPSAGRSLLVAVLFAFSLMSKPTLVTLPCLLLVLDWWPGGRVQTSRDWTRLIVEKLPLFGLAIASSVVTYLAQVQGGALKLESISPAVRAGNAAVSYLAYLVKTIWPTQLAVFYPHPGLFGSGLEPVLVTGSLVLLAAATAAALRFRSRAPYLLAGWLWYLGTLVPMIGLIQVGGQAYADRYSYFPQIGVLIALCWGAADLARARPRTAAAFGAAAALVLAALTWQQQSYWRDSVTLWEHDLRVTAASPPALYNCGEALQSQGRLDEAAARFRKTLELDAKDSDACFHLGMILQMQGRLDEAASRFETVCQLNPRSREAHSRLGDIYFRRGRNDDSARQYEMALELEPARSSTFCNLARVERARQKFDRAAEYYRSALALDPGLAEAHNGFGSLLIDRGHIEQGMAELREAIHYDPRSGQAHNNLGLALEEKGDIAAAVEQFEEAAHLSPKFGVIWFNLGRARERQKRTGEAAESYAMALELEPDTPPFQVALLRALDGLISSGHFKEAAETVRRARDHAIAAGRFDLAGQLGGILERCERGESVSPPHGPP